LLIRIIHFGYAFRLHFTVRIYTPILLLLLLYAVTQKKADSRVFKFSKMGRSRQERATTTLQELALMVF